MVRVDKAKKDKVEGHPRNGVLSRQMCPARTKDRPKGHRVAHRNA